MRTFLDAQEKRVIYSWRRFRPCHVRAEHAATETKEYKVGRAFLPLPVAVCETVTVSSCVLLFGTLLCTRVSVAMVAFFPVTSLT